MLRLLRCRELPAKKFAGQLTHCNTLLTSGQLKISHHLRIKFDLVMTVSKVGHHRHKKIIDISHNVWYSYCKVDPWSIE
jgi:hypothetical protein